MQMQKGQKSKLSDINVGNTFTVECNVQGDLIIDISCFGVDENTKLANEDYMVFYNQNTSPKGEIKFTQNGKNARFEMSPDQLPTNASKLVITAAIDGIGTMNSLEKIELKIGDATFTLSGNDFDKEKAIIIAEIYKKDNIWRLNAVGQGFNGGLEALLNHFGGNAEPTVAVVESPPVKAKISLEKQFEEKAPALVSLAKKASISLEKHNLSTVKAKTAFIIDASGSMNGQYSNGQVQETLNRVFPLGVHFDDDNELETWAFAQRSKKLSNITFDNYQKYVATEDKGWRNWMHELDARYNNEPEVITEVIKHFAGVTPPPYKIKSKVGGFLGFGGKEVDISNPEEFAPIIESKTPVFIIFISDGGVSHNAQIEHLIKWSSTLPIFWQFVGIGGNSYGALQKLDEMDNRYLDNANFFAIDDLKQISESELYDRMVNEFPLWLKEAHKKGIIDDYQVGATPKPKNKM